MSILGDDDPEPRWWEWTTIFAVGLVANAVDLTSRMWGGPIKVAVSLLIAGTLLQYALPYIMAP